ncbi:hypothetical protein PG990_011190 [Apiospora arundinis]
MWLQDCIASRNSQPLRSGPFAVQSSLDQARGLIHREAVSGSGRVLYRTAPWDSRQTHTPQTDQTSFFGTFLIFSDPIQSMNWPEGTWAPKKAGPGLFGITIPPSPVHCKPRKYLISGNTDLSISACLFARPLACLPLLLLFPAGDYDCTEVNQPIHIVPTATASYYLPLLGQELTALHLKPAFVRFFSPLLVVAVAVDLVCFLLPIRPPSVGIPTRTLAVYKPTFRRRPLLSLAQLIAGTATQQQPLGFQQVAQTRLCFLKVGASRLFFPYGAFLLPAPRASPAGLTLNAKFIPTCAWQVLPRFNASKRQMRPRDDRPRESGRILSASHYRKMHMISILHS